jgi:nucleotide-binding universal stress UspA family protein
MEIKKIVWASDGSEESEHALNYAVFIAKKYNAAIFGLYVSVIDIVSASLFAVPVYYEFMDKAEKDQKEKFSSLKLELSKTGLHFEGKVIKGDVNEEIVKFASSKKADLIIIGTRGHGLLDDMLIGSTTLKVLRNSKIPILAYKGGDKKLRIKNIVVPLEVFEKSDSTLIYALELAQKTKANITVLNVVTSGVYSYAFPESVLEESISYAYKELEKIVRNIRSKNKISSINLDRINIDIETTYGLNYGVAIADFASKKNADLIVIHTHGKKGVEKLIFGSVTEMVIRKAMCPVLTIKP